MAGLHRIRLAIVFTTILGTVSVANAQTSCPPIFCKIQILSTQTVLNPDGLPGGGMNFDGTIDNDQWVLMVGTKQNGPAYPFRVDWIPPYPTDDDYEGDFTVGNYTDACKAYSQCKKAEAIYVTDDMPLCPETTDDMTAENNVKDGFNFAGGLDNACTIF